MTFGAIVVIWIFCGLVAGLIGSLRGVGFWFHALIGFCFGPVGFITALLSNPSDEAKFKSQGDSSGLRKCPYCAEYVKKEAKICKHCRSELPSITSLESESRSTDTEIYRLYQIEIFSDHCEVNGHRFDSVDEAKGWIDAQ
jgi:hypothetical protein